MTETLLPLAPRGATRRLGVLLVATAALYLWNITVNGMGNQFYAAAVQAGSTNWKALLFGSLDARNFITVDKPPLSQWVMGISGQLFGFSSASMLIPQALMAVGAVALLYGAVTRICGPWAGLLAGATLALTPVAVLMFRFNDPDAVMVLLMTAAAYCTVRATERGSVRWLAGAGVALGFAFLAKMLEGVMVLPTLAAAYLVAAPVRLRARFTHLAIAAAAFLVAAGWFVVLTILWPASSRPYLAGSTDNTFMNLVLGYNGFARVLGRNHPDLHGFGGGQSHGWARLFSGEFGVEIGWLLPAAMLATVLTVIVRGRAPRTDATRAATILFGGWLLVDGLVLSYMHGTTHPYYSLSIAPPVAAIFAIGLHQMWSRREMLLGRAGLAALLVTAGGWGWWRLGHSAMASPALRWTVVLVTVVGAAALLWTRVRHLAPAFLIVGLAGALGGPAAYSVATVGVSHQGGGPMVGPRPGHLVSARVGNPVLDEMLETAGTPWSAAIDRSSSAAALELSTSTAVMAIGGFSGTDPTPTLPQFQDDVARHRVGYYLSGHGVNRDGAPDDDPREGWADRPHADILGWVRTHFHAMSVGGVTVYDLADPK